MAALWRLLPEAIQNDLAEMAIAEVHENAKEIAHDILDDYDPEYLAWILLMEAGIDEFCDEPAFEQRQADVARLIKAMAPN